MIRTLIPAAAMALALTGCSGDSSSPATVTVTATPSSTGTTATPTTTSTTAPATSLSEPAPTTSSGSTATAPTSTVSATDPTSTAAPTLVGEEPEPTDTLTPEPSEITGKFGETLTSPTGSTVRVSLKGKSRTYDEKPCERVEFTLTNKTTEIMDTTMAGIQVFDTDSTQLEHSTELGSDSAFGSSRLRPGKSTTIKACYETKGRPIQEAVFDGSLAKYVWTR